MFISSAGPPFARPPSTRPPPSSPHPNTLPRTSPSAGPPKIPLFFFPLPSSFSLFFSVSGCFGRVTTVPNPFPLPTNRCRRKHEHCSPVGLAGVLLQGPPTTQYCMALTAYTLVLLLVLLQYWLPRQPLSIMSTMSLSRVLVHSNLTMYHLLHILP